MNLLVFNIRTDADHPTQGVTTRWLNKLAEYFDHIYVITMHKGRLELKQNIDVYSIGGELGYSRMRKLVIFYKLLFTILKDHEIKGCFTHMAVLSLLLGGPFLALKGVPRITWYAHSVINPVLIGAYLNSNVIITPSPDSFRINSKKVHVTGHGIDTSHYSRIKKDSEEGFIIGSVGRISKIKNYETLIKALSLLVEDGIDSFQVKLYGNTQTQDDEAYRRFLEKLVNKLGLENKIYFPGPITGDQVPKIVSTFDIFINMLSKGGAGKAVLEAMSIEVPTLICTPAFNKKFSEKDHEMLVFRPNDPESLKNKLKELMNTTEEKRIQIGKRLRKIVIEEHSLDNLALNIVNILMKHK